MLLKGANSINVVWGDIAKDVTAKKPVSSKAETKVAKQEEKYSVLDWSFVNKLTDGPKEKAPEAKAKRPEENYTVLDWRFVSKLTK